MRNLKHNILKELWLNRPWVYIPAVIEFMRSFPYIYSKSPFWKWLKTCLYVCWEDCWE